MQDKTMPVCCTPEQYRAIEAHARRMGMLDASSGLEDIIQED